MHDIEINQYEKIAPIANKDALKSKCSRRKFLRGLTFGGLFSITPASLYAFAFEPEHIRLAEVTISIQGLPANSDGIRIGHISDTHCDTDRALRRTSRAVDLLLSQKPDAIFLTGDYITAKVYDRMPKTADALAPLSKARLGAYAVMGNHDWWAGDPEFVAQSLTRAGITVLRNQSIKVRGTDLWAVGLEQRCNNLQKPDKALKLVPVDAIKLLLMHEPDTQTRLRQGLPYSSRVIHMADRCGFHFFHQSSCRPTVADIQKAYSRQYSTEYIQQEV